MHYDPSTGHITRNGKRIGYLHHKSKRRAGRSVEVVSIVRGGRKVKIPVHRLAFELMGEPVPEMVDHINGDCLDNRWCNLRPCTAAQNAHNSSLRYGHPTGVKGVMVVKNPYRAMIMCRGVRYKSAHPTLESAEAWVKELRAKLHGEFARDA